MIIAIKPSSPYAAVKVVAKDGLDRD